MFLARLSAGLSYNRGISYIVKIRHRQRYTRMLASVWSLFLRNIPTGK